MFRTIPTSGSSGRMFYEPLPPQYRKDETRVPEPAELTAGHHRPQAALSNEGP